MMGLVSRLCLDVGFPSQPSHNGNLDTNTTTSLLHGALARILQHKREPAKLALIAAASRMQRLRRDTVLGPLDEGGQGIGRDGPGAAAAMLDAGGQEEAVEVVHLTAHGLLDAQPVVEDAVGEDERVGPVVPRLQLAARVAERRQVRVRCADQLRLVGTRLRQDAREGLAAVERAQRDTRLEPGLGILQYIAANETASLASRQLEMRHFCGPGDASPGCSSRRRL
ncbi:hypothetical protein DL767_009581 [Monosporascus sp. MG133]|nr:hypothetical protein DL767_009581 [Monosporascus sp. MG133]